MCIFQNESAAISELVDKDRDYLLAELVTLNRRFVPCFFNVSCIVQIHELVENLHLCDVHIHGFPKLTFPKMSIPLFDKFAKVQTTLYIHPSGPNS